jgi:hypothetical protein
VVLDAVANDRGAVNIRSTLTCDGGAFWITAAHHFGNATGRVVGDYGFESGMCLKEPAALRECDRMRLHCLNQTERRAGTANQVLHDLDLNLVAHGQRVEAQQVD